MSNAVQNAFNPNLSARSLRDASERDQTRLTNLGSKMTNKKDALYKAIESGDPAKVKIAEMEFEEAATAFQAFAQATKRMMDVIREIINNMR